MLSRWRWQSIDRKLPLLASGLVLVTVVVLGWAAYALFERVLLDRAGQRLLTSARVVTEMFGLPQRRRDSIAVGAERVLVAHVRGAASRRDALAALQRLRNPRDTTVFHTALLDTTGRVLVDAHRPGAGEPRWAMQVVARRQLPDTDGLVLGPIESLGGAPVLSYVFPLADSTRRGRTTVAWVAESRYIANGRVARLIRDMIGSGVTLQVGQPDRGAWTDLERVVPAPAREALSQLVVDVDGSLAASSAIRGSPWMVWVSQSKREILAPTRTLLWTMLPLGFGIAVVAAALMWRIAARIADREALELQLRHAQKVEAVGRLAGGIAHDFNNLLTAIRSYAELLIADMSPWDARRVDVEEIRKATERATQLTSQLLAYSRKQMLQPRVLAIGAVLSELEPMLRRLLIENIRLTVRAPDELWTVRADRGQLEQVIVNFAVNARDAMTDGGVLLIDAHNEIVASPMQTHQGVIPVGEYVVISVSDTGTGMDEATQSRVFEPFFTTKDVGRGTGLGLATVHGIVAQSNGYVTLTSRVGVGSTFTVYLPRERVQQDARARGDAGTAS